MSKAARFLFVAGVLLTGCSSEPTEVETELTSACKMFLVHSVRDDAAPQAIWDVCACSVESLSKVASQDEIKLTSQAAIEGFKPFLGLTMQMMDGKNISIEAIQNIDGPSDAAKSRLSRFAVHIAVCEEQLGIVELEF